MRYLRESLIASLLLIASAANAQTPAPSAADLETAKKSFATGLALIKDPESPRYDEALLHFQRAYELSGSWKALGNVALCSLKLERDGAAIEAYEKYLELGGKKLDPGDRAQAERDLEALRAQVVSLELTFPEPGVALIDERLDVSGKMVVNEYEAKSTTLKLGVHPGRHTITAKLSSGDVRWETRLEPASTISHEFVRGQQAEAAASPAPAEPRAPASTEDKGAADTAGRGFDLRIPAYASFGVAAVGVGVGVLFALKSQDARSQADDLCNGDQCPLSRRDQIRGLQEDANDRGRLAWIGFALGGAGAAAGVTLLVLHGQQKPESAGVRAFVGVGGAGLAGRF
jgi:hypothetical protein